MSGDLNKFMFIGRLGADPESRTFPNGDPVCNFRVATAERWKDKTSGERKESTEWVSVVAIGKIATPCIDYLRKGSRIYGEGKLRTRKWQDKQGVDRYTTEVILQSMQMLDTKAESEARAAGQASRPSTAPKAAPGQRAAAPAEAGDFDDDIPF